MRKLLLAAGVAAMSIAVAAQANAGVTFVFDGGAPSPSAGYTVIDNFNNSATALNGWTGSGYQLKVPPADGNGAPPANSSPAGTQYLSVLAGGSAIYTFAKPVSSFEFDWGSVDTYNTLTLFYSGGSTVITGGQVAPPANGDQSASATNGLFIASGASFTGFELQSSSNSYEIDNVAIPGGVPEPASWAMLILGVAMIGFGLRRRNANVAFSA